MSGAYLGEIHVLATSDVGWALTTGVHPYQNAFSVHKSQWEQIRFGQPQTLTLTGLNGTIEIRDLYPLYEVPGDSPNRRTFVLSDKRWLWPYKVVIRDYNVTRQTGDRVLLREDVEQPIELAQFRDRFQYMTYSLREKKHRWKAKQVLSDVLAQIESKWEIDSLPLSASEGEEGQSSIQNLLMRDRGDVALARVLGMIPGAEVYVGYDGTVRVMDGSDLAATEHYREDLGPIFQQGSYPRKTVRKVIRPSTVHVYFVREMEVRFDYSENWEGTVVAPRSDDPFVENVLPLPDPITHGVRLRDEDGRVQVTSCPQGTWVPVREAMRVWEAEREASGSGGLPITWETLKYHWIDGNLFAQWTNLELDLLTDGSMAARARTLLEHFRKTWRVNPKYMTNVRELRGVRVALLDPVTATRSPAMAWSQYSIVPSAKGQRAVMRAAPERAGNVYNVDSYPGLNGELDLYDASQATVRVIDGKLGVFELSYAPSPYGTTASFIPGHIVNEKTNKPVNLRRALRHQDAEPIFVGAAIEGVAGGVLDPSFELAVCLSIIPNAPNDKRQMHRHEVTPMQISETFRTAYGITGGSGPPLEIFVPPSVCTARFGWLNTEVARRTISDLMGSEEDDEPGLRTNNVPGYSFVNGRDEIPGNAKAAAAEALVNYVDTLAGTPRTKPHQASPEGGVSAVSHAIEQGGRFATTHTFRGRQVSVDRYALLSNEVRHITLGIIPYRADER